MNPPGMPAASYLGRFQVSMKNPRASPKTFGSTMTTPGNSVGMVFMILDDRAWLMDERPPTASEPGDPPEEHSIGGHHRARQAPARVGPRAGGPPRSLGLLATLGPLLRGELQVVPLRGEVVVDPL